MIPADRAVQIKIYDHSSFTFSCLYEWHDHHFHLKVGFSLLPASVLFPCYHLNQLIFIDKLYEI